MPTYAQLFCTVQDLVSDAQSPGVDETRMYQAIREASDYVQKEIGWFIPVTLTRSFHGRSKTELFIPPLLAITSITNDGTSLVSTDYILKPDNGFWADGPYARLVVDPDAANLSEFVSEEDGVVIIGKWGKYNRSVSTSATVADTTSQTDSQTTLKVSNGSQVSPGMVLLIGTEQELVTGWGDPTASVTTVTEPVANTDETLTLADASLVNVGEVIRIDYEQMFVRDRRTTPKTVSVIRGWNGTGRVTHADNAVVDAYRTVNVTRGVNGTTAAAHLNGVAISRYVAPDDIQFLTKEIATLIANKAKGGYQGRSGDANLGVVFYHDAFPRADIERIRDRYYIPRVP